MFENGSYLRRRKRFKTTLNERKTSENDEPSKKSITNSSFLIENLLANETSTNTSVASSETNHPIQQYLYPTEFDLFRQLTLPSRKFFW